MNPTVRALIQKLGLRPLPDEGGFFAETYRCPTFAGGRRLSSAIYYLVTPEEFSALHRVRNDEMFHFYAGDAVEMLRLRADGTCSRDLLGSDVLSGAIPQLLVPAGEWQGTRLLGSGAWALLGCTVTPGFEYEDFELGNRDELMKIYPQHAEDIRNFTRAPRASAR